MYMIGMIIIRYEIYDMDVAMIFKIFGIWKKYIIQELI